jgi:23S rRNA pseudouridine1911/1915/1917 synthase
MLTGITVLYEDNHLLVVNKPPGVSTMGEERADEETVHSWACDYIRQRYDKPGRVYVGVVHRLDRLTSGVLVLARTSKAASRLSEQFRREGAGTAGDAAESGTAGGETGDAAESGAAEGRPPEKTYLAVVQGRMETPHGLLRDWLVKNERRERMEMVAADRRRPPGAVEAVLEYRSLRRGQEPGRADVELLQVRLRTGRKHQIRVQFAERGHPIDGDDKYGGGDAPGGGRKPSQGSGTRRPGIALHAWRLSLDHPTTKTRMTWVAPIPETWKTRYPQFRPWPEA